MEERRTENPKVEESKTSVATINSLTSEYGGMADPLVSEANEGNLVQVQVLVLALKYIGLYPSWLRGHSDKVVVR